LPNPKTAKARIAIAELPKNPSAVKTMKEKYLTRSDCSMLFTIIFAIKLIQSIHGIAIYRMDEIATPQV